MGITTQRNSEPFQGRILVHLSDSDGDDVSPHGLALAPASIKSQEEALTEVDRLFNEAVAEAGDEWDYDDVLTKLEANGFTLLHPVYWEESERPIQYPDTEA